jgi:hypothetical protein
MPDPWANSPYVTLKRERGTVTIWALGEGRLRVLAEGEIKEEHIITGDRVSAHRLAHQLADRLGAPLGPLGRPLDG